MLKTKKSTLMILITLIMILMLSSVMFISKNNLAYAAELKLGEANYDGSTYYCYYDIKGDSNKIEGTTFDETGFVIYMQGVSAKKNPFKKFTYNIQFTLTAPNGSIKIATVSFDTRNLKVTGDIRYIFDSKDLSGSGVYTLSWYGTISSHSVSTLQESYQFTIA